MKYIVRKFGFGWNVMRSTAPWKPIASFLEWRDAFDLAVDLTNPDEKTVGGLYHGRG